MLNILIFYVLIRVLFNVLSRVLFNVLSRVSTYYLSKGRQFIVQDLLASQGLTYT